MANKKDQKELDKYDEMRHLLNKHSLLSCGLIKDKKLQHPMAKAVFIGICFREKEISASDLLKACYELKEEIEEKKLNRDRRKRISQRLAHCLALSNQESLPKIRILRETIMDIEGIDGKLKEAFLCS